MRSLSTLAVPSRWRRGCDSRYAGWAEEFFDHSTVEDGDLEPAEFVDDAGKVKQPKGLRRQGAFPYLL